MAKKITKRKRERQKQARINFCIDVLLSFFVIILPLIAIILYAFGVDIPKIVFGIYVSVVFIATGGCLLLLPHLKNSVLEKQENILIS